MTRNLESFGMLQSSLEDFGIDKKRFPLVLQYNKRDLPQPVSLGTLEVELGLNDIPVFEAVATEGLGVMDTIRTVSRQVIEKFQI